MSATGHVLVGFGFGPIQSGLFAKEAADSGRFSEIVIAEVDAALVAAVRGNGDRYGLNVAHADGVETVTVEGVKLLNPHDSEDLKCLREALGRATEIVTSLPSVDFYARGAVSVAQLIAQGLQTGGAAQTIVYTAENNNHAAEILEREVREAAGGGARLRPVQMLNTVIGKMSQVMADADEIGRRGLAPIAPRVPRAFLVEAFNRILVSRVALPGFEPGITAFEQKPDLLPFEEAKLYGHNAAHTMLGFLALREGFSQLCEMRARPDGLAVVRRAFLEEAGAALTAAHRGLGDALFTPEGFERYVDDLLERMTNPYLGDTVARAVRDPRRKLARADRLFGAIRCCLAQGVDPLCLGFGALAGLRAWTQACSGVSGRRAGWDRLDAGAMAQGLGELWGADPQDATRVQVAELLVRAQDMWFQ